MAFHLQNSAYLRDLRTKTAQKHILVVERNDPESITGAYQPAPASAPDENLSTWKQRIPQPVRQAIYRHITTPLKHRVIAKRLGEQDIYTAFTQECLNRLIQDDPTRADLPIFAADISDPALCNFRRFSQLIAEAAVVVATRLHVGILAAMLDKPTYIQSGFYHKIRGIYEYSLVDSKHVQLF
jgi:exopolysaccharide biosynthesis predicted pyruvyltransferase EpsI